MPHNLSQAASNVATDAYNSAYNLGGPRITYLSVLDAASGTLKRGTFLLTREGGASGKGNSLQPAAVAVDSAGHIYLAHTAASTMEDQGNCTVNQQHCGAEGPGLLVLSADLKQRVRWALFSKPAGPPAPLGGGPASSAVDVASRAGRVAFVASATEAMLEVSPARGSSAPSPGRTGGYLVLMSALDAGNLDAGTR